MAREKEEARGIRPEFPALLLRSRKEAELEFAKPCGRFSLPAGTEEKLLASIVGRIGNLDPLHDSYTFVGSGVPLNWQRLLGFLHERHMIAAPRFDAQIMANDLPYIHKFSLTFDRASHPTDGSRTNPAGYGAAFDPEIAMSKAIGEMLERNFLATYSQRSLVRASANELRRKRYRTPDLADFPGFLAFQRERFPFLGVDAEAPLSWIAGEEYQSGKKVMLPAQSVFWNFEYNDADGKPFERVLNRATTSGSAGHFSKEEAVLAGLLESIQRDAFLIYWLNSLTPRVLDIDPFDDAELQTHLAYLKRYGLEATFLNTTSDVGIPTITCVITDRHAKEPIIAVGASTGFDAGDALRQSVIEAMLVHSYVYQLEKFALPEKYEPFLPAKLGRKERLSAWRGKEALERFSFFLSGEKQSVEECMGAAARITGVKAQLAHTLDRLRALGKGYEVYVYEVQDPLLRDIGYHVVRTIVPKLIPLYLLEHTAALASLRLKEVPEKIGYKAADTLNPWPHPFP